MVLVLCVSFFSNIKKTFFLKLCKDVGEGKVQAVTFSESNSVPSVVLGAGVGKMGELGTTTSSGNLYSSRRDRKTSAKNYCMALLWIPLHVRYCALQSA